MVFRSWSYNTWGFTKFLQGVDNLSTLHWNLICRLKTHVHVTDLNSPLKQFHKEKFMSTFLLWALSRKSLMSDRMYLSRPVTNPEALNIGVEDPPTCSQIPENIHSTALLCQYYIKDKQPLESFIDEFVYSTTDPFLWIQVKLVRHM